MNENKINKDKTTSSLIFNNNLTKIQNTGIFPLLANNFISIDNNNNSSSTCSNNLFYNVKSNKEYLEIIKKCKYI